MNTLTLTGGYTPSDVQSTATSASYTTGAIEIPGTRRNLATNANTFESLLSNMGVKSSTISNLIGPVLILGILIAFHLLVSLLRLYKLEEKKNKDLEYYYFLALDIIHDYMTFSVYFRFLIIIFQYLLLVSVSTMYKQGEFGGQDGLDLTVAIFLFIFCVGFIIFSYYMYYTATFVFKMRMFNHTGEFFRGLRDSSLARLYIPIQLSRRFALICWVISTTAASSSVTVSGMVVMQLFGLISILAMRPFQVAIFNIVEVINETFMTFFFIWMLYYNSEERWTTRATYLFTHIILLNIFLNLLLSLLVLATIIYEKCKKKPKEKKYKHDSFEHVSDNPPGSELPDSEVPFKAQSTGLYAMEKKTPMERLSSTRKLLGKQTSLKGILK